MFRGNIFSLLISSAVLVINPLISLLLFCWRIVNECYPFWLLHIHFSCKLCHKPYDYFSDLSSNSSNSGNIRQQDNCFPLAFVTNEPPLLPCHSWGTSVLCSGQGAQEHIGTVMLFFRVLIKLLPTELCQLLRSVRTICSHEGESLGSFPVMAALLQLGWRRCGDGITTGLHLPPPLSAAAWSSGSCTPVTCGAEQPCRKCWSYWCVCTGLKGAWNSSSGTIWHLSRERCLLQVPYPQARKLWHKYNLINSPKDPG